jgi:hypothetical protein
MSAREAYIAGRSGGSRPPTKQTRGSDPSETQRNTQQQDREQKSFDAGQQERQREQTIKQEGIQGLSQRDQEQAKTIAQNVAKQGIFKDPYNTLTREEQIDAGYPKTGIETLGSLSLDDIIDKAPSLLLKGIAGGAKGLQLLLDKAFKPELKDFSNPNFLAVLDAAFKSGKLNKDQYTQKYEDLLNDVYSGQAKENLEAGIGGLDSEGLFDLAMEEATANVEPGSGTQRITDPEGFYMDDGKGMMPQTTDGLENLARLDTKGLEGTNPDLVKMIFNARAILDQNKGNQGGGGAGIPSLYGGPITQDYGFEDKDKLLQVVLGYGPMDRMNYTAVMPREGYQYSYDQQGRRYEIPIGGNQSGGTTYGGNPFTFREGGPNIPPQAIGDKFKTGIPSLAPTSIDYASMGPQYGGYVNQGISDPRFASYFQNLQMFPRRS